jgi:ribosomal protein S18 acetylase RimI-like enzyme
VSTVERVRVAKPADVAAITETISLAFHDDPTWSWAFPDEERRQEQSAVWWRFLIEAAMRFDDPAVFVTDGAEAAAIWLPPGESELSPEDEERTPELVRDLVGDHADAFMELLEGFETVQPADPPHYYLSLLGVHDEHRGKGIGMDLLRDNIARFDREGVATYLESSNAINNGRYEGLGFRKIGEFNTPDHSATITAYLRDPGGTV